MKKLLALIISALLTLTLFTACTATKPKETLTPTPPTEGTTKAEEIAEVAKTTLPEKQEEKNTSAPQEKITSATKADVIEEKTQQNKPTEKISATKPVSTTKKDLNISKDKAKEIALGHAGLIETDIRHYRSELDRERKAIVYEIEFDSGKYEYEYEINADTGKVIKAEKEKID